MTAHILSYRCIHRYLVCRLKRLESRDFSHVRFTSPVVNKARMLKKLAMELNIAEDEIMVFGDGENDISLFKNFCHSRAVANSVPEIKNMAERVIESCDHDGAAKEIMRIRSAWMSKEEN